MPPSPRKKKKLKDTVGKCKDRIQALLRAIAIVLWKKCEAAGTPEGANQVCDDILQFDHIESRGFANTFALVENGILLCHNHHFYWKRNHPKRWGDLVERTRGRKLLADLRSAARKSTITWGLKDWQKVEQELKQKLSHLTNI